MRGWMSIGAALALLAGVTAPAPVAAEEFKLVLEPEPGGGLPARVCLATRSRATAEARGESGIVGLTTQARCAGDRCIVDRGAPPARCAECPAEAHPDCASAVRTGRFDPDQWTLVCADDDTWSADGGTVYIAVESVEAESPPEFYTLEVSGGRVRWSPVKRFRKPSYRVMGGDFEASPVAYPRGGTRPEWVQVPVRRRCRCVDTRQPTGGVAVTAADVDGVAVCRGQIAADGRMSVEVPVNRSGRSRVLTVATADSRATTTWVGRWPETGVTLRLTSFDFPLELGCTVPRGEACPTIGGLRWACAATGPDGDTCRYRCTVSPGAAVSLPVNLDVSIDTPEMRWTQPLVQPGQRLRLDVPPDDRVLTVALPEARFDGAGDRVEAIEISRFGIQTNRLLVGTRGPGRLYLPMPGLTCNAPLTLTYEGDRGFLPSTAQVEPGARVQAPPPDERASITRSEILVTYGYGVMGIQDFDNLERRFDDSLIAASMHTGFRFRPFAHPWYATLRLGLSFMPDWPVISEITYPDGTTRLAQSEASIMASGELLVGRTQSVFRAPVDIYGGLGAGGAYLVDVDKIHDIGFIGSFIGIIGLRYPFDGAGRWAAVGEARGFLTAQAPPLLEFDENPPESNGVIRDTPPDAFIDDHLVSITEGETYFAWAGAIYIGLSHLF